MTDSRQTSWGKPRATKFEVKDDRSRLQKDYDYICLYQKQRRQGLALVCVITVALSVFGFCLGWRRWKQIRSQGTPPVIINHQTMRVFCGNPLVMTNVRLWTASTETNIITGTDITITLTDRYGTTYTYPTSTIPGVIITAQSPAVYTSTSWSMVCKYKYITNYWKGKDNE